MYMYMYVRTILALSNSEICHFFNTMYPKFISIYASILSYLYLSTASSAFHGLFRTFHGESARSADLQIGGDYFWRSNLIPGISIHVGHVGPFCNVQT